MNKQNQTHHHGNLREALVTAGFELMEEGGLEALTLRKCAARAGVSHAAPAHHFNGLISLKAAIIAKGYAQFSDYMRKEMSAADPNPHAQLIAICDGYITFAAAHTTVFKFMFQPHDIDATQINTNVMEELGENASQSFAILEKACKLFSPLPGAPQGLETLIWSMVHGYAMLFCDPKSDTPINPVPSFSVLLSAIELKPKP